MKALALACLTAMHPLPDERARASSPTEHLAMECAVERKRTNLKYRCGPFYVVNLVPIEVGATSALYYMLVHRSLGEPCPPLPVLLGLYRLSCTWYSTEPMLYDPKRLAISGCGHSSPCTGAVGSQRV